MNKSARLLARFQRLPGGLWLFTRILCLKAPYFASIRPTFTRLEPGRGEAMFRDRRAVHNHLGTVHAIAIANLCELVAGVTLEVTLPNSHRWIPKSMKIHYLAKASGDIRASTEIAPSAWPETGSVDVLVEVFDPSNKIVVKAEIEMYVSKRK